MRVATRSFIEAGSSLARESIALPKDRVAAVALPLKTVYDLAAKTTSVYGLLQNSTPKVIRSTIYLQSTVAALKRFKRDVEQHGDPERVS
jgi:hypothetical protein